MSSLKDEKSAFDDDHGLLYRLTLETEGALVIADLSPEDEGEYQCFAKNLYGTRGSRKANVSILGKVSKTRV